MCSQAAAAMLRCEAPPDQAPSLCARCGRGTERAGRGRAQSAGRTREERQRRQYVEGRLEALAQQISHLRLELKRHS